MQGRRSGAAGAPLLAYALPALPLAMLTLPVYIHLPAFYGATLGIGLANAGLLLLAARLFDAFSDPLVGIWCDRFGRRWGRRRVWMVAATPAVMLATWQLFVPPEGAGGAHLLIWSLLLYGGWTALMLPYQAWGAELSEDYDGRSRIAGAREAMVVAGTCIAATLPAMAQWLTAGNGSGALQDTASAAALSWFAWIVAGLLPATVLACLLFVREPQVATAPAPSLRAGLRLMARNRPFLLLLAAYLANGTANGLAATLFLLFVEHRLAAPEQGGALLLAYFLAGLVSVPLWLRASRALGKHRAWMLGMALACAGFLAVPFLGAGDVGAFLAVCLFTGLCLGADLALPPAIQADVVDLDTLRGGGGRTGTYFAAWSMATKLALALAVGIAFPVLDLAGFDPAAEAAAPSDTLVLALLYGALPIPIKLLAIVLVRRYPIDRARQMRVRSLIDRRRGAAFSRLAGGDSRSPSRPAAP